MKINRKVFLDPENPHETGSVCWLVNTEEYDTPSAIDAEVKLYDCSRSITLDFDCYSKEDLTARVRKLDVLISELTEMRNLLNSYEQPKYYY